MIHPSHRRAARLTASAQASYEHRIVQSISAEPAFCDPVCLAKRFDIAEKVVHAETMRRIYPSGQADNDGFVRRLFCDAIAWDMSDMSVAPIDIEKIKDVLRRATDGPDAKFSQRGLAKAADENRDCVGDIINGRNRNPTIKVLGNLARAMGGDLSLFGLQLARSEPPTEDEVREQLIEHLPRMPKGSVERRARFLAGVLSDALRLPRDRKATDLEPMDQAASPAASAPPRLPTN